MKTSSVTEVLASIRGVLDNANSAIVNQKVVNEMVRLRYERESLMCIINLMSRLTKSEMEVLQMVYDGYSYRDIAKIRHVEGVTIRSFVNKILKKNRIKEHESFGG